MFAAPLHRGSVYRLCRRREKRNDPSRWPEASSRVPQPDEEQALHQSRGKAEQSETMDGQKSDAIRITGFHRLVWLFQHKNLAADVRRSFLCRKKGREMFNEPGTVPLPSFRKVFAFSVTQFGTAFTRVWAGQKKKRNRTSKVVEQYWFLNFTGFLPVFAHGLTQFQRVGSTLSEFLLIFTGFLRGVTRNWIARGVLNMLS